MEHNEIERNETQLNKQNGTTTSFYCLGILRWDRTNFLFHCLKSGWNGMNYDIFIPILVLYNY